MKIQYLYSNIHIIYSIFKSNLLNIRIDSIQLTLRIISFRILIILCGLWKNNTSVWHSLKKLNLPIGVEVSRGPFCPVCLPVYCPALPFLPFAPFVALCCLLLPLIAFYVPFLPFALHYIAEILKLITFIHGHLSLFSSETSA